MDNLIVNEEYAKKFQKNKEKQFTQKAKAKGGFIPKDGGHESESESNDVSEDSEGEMVNETVKAKFLDVLLKLKDNTYTDELAKLEKPIFNDEDFTERRDNLKKKQDKIGFSVRDALIVEEDEADDVFNINYVPKAKKEDEEKKDFIRHMNDDDDNDDDNGFSFLKKKENETKIPEAPQEGDKPKETEMENLTLDQALEKSKIKSKNINLDLLKNIWGEEKLQDKNEKFLRNYILSEAWLENDENRINKKLLLIDKEDEEKEEIFDKFEQSYNHRFEEDGGANITTYQRNIADTFRKKDDSRATKRKEKEKRKDEEIGKIKNKLTKEKEKQIEEVMNKIKKISAKDKLEKLAQQLEEDSDFEMDKFDQKMNEIFKDENMADINDEYNPEEEELEEEEVNEGGEDLWFYCDNCRIAIKEKKIKYECTTCDDFTLCKSCFKSMVNNPHPHRMKKDQVPIGCPPPSNWKELLEQNEKEDTEEKICTNCQNEITQLRYYICEECKDVRICKTCRGIGKSVHPEHKLVKIRVNTDSVETEVKPKDKIKQILEGKISTVVDELIAKEIPTKFHYTKVDKDDTGLTNEMMLYVDDHLLQKYVPLKKLAPYETDYKLNLAKRESMLRQFEKIVEKKKKELIAGEEERNELEEQNKKTMKLLNKKSNRETTDDDAFKKKKRLETYGLV